jgi:NADPH2:quinone reductase
MHAIRIHEHGGADKLAYEEVDLPSPKAGEVRVRVQASGLNFADIYQRKGQYQATLPSTLGTEFVGTVDALGEGITEFKEGDRLATASGIGGYAEYAIAPVARSASVPANVSLEQAAALMMHGLTAHYLACSTYPLKPGDLAVIHAAGGGVGQILVQLAKKRGAQVIATVSTEDKARLAREAGADHVILYSNDDFEAAARRLTGGRGVDVVYDSVGQATFDKSLNCLRPRGYLVLFGQASGPVAPMDPQILNRRGSLFLTRPTLAHYIQTRAEFLQRTDDLFGWLASGELKIRVDKTFPLKEAAAAQTYMEQRKTKGKVLLIP